MVLGYLAYETLGRLVELCLLVRRDAARYVGFVLISVDLNIRSNIVSNYNL